MKPLRQTILPVVAILLMVFGLSGTFAQKPKESKAGAKPKGVQPPPPPRQRPPKVAPPQPTPDDDEEDYNEDEHARFLKVYEAEKDPVKKADGLIDYIKNGKSVTLKSYAIGAFNHELYPNYLQAKNHPAMADLAEKFLALPRDLLQELDQEGPKRKNPVTVRGEETYVQFIARAAEAYDHLKNKPKIVEWGEKLFKETPLFATAYTLATTYHDLKNYAKYVEWSEKALEMTTDTNIKTDIQVSLFRFYIDRKKNDEAMKYAEAFMTTLPDMKKPDRFPANEWPEYKDGNLADAYFLKGENAFHRKDYKKALPLFEKVLTYDPRRDGAWAYMAYGRWHSGDPQTAMLDFARCDAMQGQMAPKCLEELEKIYSKYHNDTTIGIKNIYRKAGVSQPVRAR